MYCGDSVFIISTLSDVTCLPDNVQIKKMDSLFALLLGDKAASTHFEYSSPKSSVMRYPSVMCRYTRRL